MIKIPTRRRAPEPEALDDQTGPRFKKSDAAPLYAIFAMLSFCIIVPVSLVFEGAYTPGRADRSAAPAAAETPSLLQAPLPSSYRMTEDLEARVAGDIASGDLPRERLGLWVYQALMADLLDRLPEAAGDETRFPVEARLSHIRRTLETSSRRIMPAEDAARALAYAQGVATARGWIDIDAERDRMRPLLGLPGRLSPAQGGRD